MLVADLGCESPVVSRGTERSTRLLGFVFVLLEPAPFRAVVDPRPAGTEFEVSTTVETPPVPTRYVVVVEQTEPDTPRPTPTE